MSTISNQPMMTGQTSQAKQISDAQFSSYIKKQSVSAYESLDAGLTIKTKEGDVVTLTSNSYAELDAQMYNSKGVVQTESGRAMVTQNSREITLSSGESFSFSVVGDLNEEELMDIENIVKDIDEIISVVVNGDMDEAVDKALSMGGYDSVSMYSADIAYQRSYQMTSQVQAETMTPLPNEEPNVLQANKRPDNSLKSLNSENNNFHKTQSDIINNLFEKISDTLGKYEDKLVEKAQKPINNLFWHHIDDIIKSRDGEDANKQSNHTDLDKIREKVEKLIDKTAEKIFQNDFKALFE